MEPVPFDLLSASDADARARHALAATVLTELQPDDPVPPLDAMRLGAQYGVPWQRAHERAVWDGDAMVGWGRVELEDRDTNQRVAKGRLEVHPDFRRRGIGTSLLAAVVEVARKDGRTLLGVSAKEESAGAVFLAAAGAENRQRVRISRMQTTDIDVDLMRTWVARARERAPGYALVAWDDPCPEELLAQFADVVDVMNTAPLDDLDAEDEHYGPDDIRAWATNLQARGHEGWVIAVRDPDGRFVGFTELGFWPWAPELAFQGDTGVHPDHRDRGLGRWLKAAMVLRLLAERPAVRAVETGNAGSNRPMLSINEAMGFRPSRLVGNWQLPI